MEAGIGHDAELKADVELETGKELDGGGRVINLNVSIF